LLLFLKNFLSSSEGEGKGDRESEDLVKLGWVKIKNRKRETEIEKKQ
jgi:hypothetical protein